MPLDNQYFLPHIAIIMNYFAHLVLSQPTVESTVGNLLGDFARGLKREALHRSISAGLDNHRAVDRFTDAHPAVQTLKKAFSPKRRRFAGIALDVYFDHLLMKHWSSFGSQPLEIVINRFYQRMIDGQSLMPNRNMRSTTKRMVEHDWFSSYLKLDSITYALDRIAGRIRYENNFDNVIEDILANQDDIEAVFLAFFPELKMHITALALET